MGGQIAANASTGKPPPNCVPDQRLKRSRAWCAAQKRCKRHWTGGGMSGLLRARRPEKALGFTSQTGVMTEDRANADGPVVIKKYANRRLYNTETSSYVTLDHLSQMVKKGK